MKKIFIIEDNEHDWETIKSWVHLDYKCYPSTLLEFEELRGDIDTLYAKGIDDEVVAEAKNKLIKLLKKHKPDLIIVDYELKEDDEFCNGIQLVKDFISRKNVLFMSGIVKDGAAHIKNEIILFAQSGHNENKMHFLNKEDFKKKDFKDLLLSWVEKFLQADKPEEKFDRQKMKPKSKGQ